MTTGEFKQSGDQLKRQDIVY